MPKAGDNPTLASVLLFDDLDQLEDDEALSLLNAVFVTNSPRIRIILTGTDQKFQTCLRPPGIKLDSLCTLRVEEHNEPDIKRFIDSRLTDSRALHGVFKISHQIRDKLPRISSGNFNHAEQVIRKISGGVEDDIEENEILQTINERSCRVQM